MFGRVECDIGFGRIDTLEERLGVRERGERVVLTMNQKGWWSVTRNGPGVVGEERIVQSEKGGSEDPGLKSICQSAVVCGGGRPHICEPIHDTCKREYVFHLGGV